MMRRARLWTGRRVMCATTTRRLSIDRFRRGRGRGTDARSRGVGMSRRRAVGGAHQGRIHEHEVLRCRGRRSRRRQSERTFFVARWCEPSHASASGRMRAAPRGIACRRRVARDAGPAGARVSAREARDPTRDPSPRERRRARVVLEGGGQTKRGARARRRSEQWARMHAKNNMGLNPGYARANSQSLIGARPLARATPGLSRRSLAPPRARARALFRRASSPSHPGF